MLKLSYSCMPSMKSIILSHNKTILSDYNTTPMQQPNKQYNCRTKDECPLQGKCLETNIVYMYMYQVLITSKQTSKQESYIRLATNCKEHFRNHTTSFRHTNKRNSTELSMEIERHQETLQYTIVGVHNISVPALLMVLKTILVDMCKLDLHNFHKVSSPKLGHAFAEMIPLRLYGNIDS